MESRGYFSCTSITWYVNYVNLYSTIFVVKCTCDKIFKNVHKINWVKSCQVMKIYILLSEKKTSTKPEIFFLCIDAEEFTNKMKDLCGDKAKDDIFYHGLWKISDCGHNFAVYPGKTNIYADFE